MKIRNKQSLTGNVGNPNKLQGDINIQNQLSGSVNISSAGIQTPSIITKQSLDGDVDVASKLHGDISTQDKLLGSVSISSVFTASNEVYNGPYSVTPSVDAQTLNTKEKTMVDDVTIQKIPYYEVSNNSGGLTATICELEV